MNFDSFWVWVPSRTFFRFSTSFRFLFGTKVTVAGAAVILLLAAHGTLQATPVQADNATTDFGRDILPIFREHCFRCHGPEQQQSNYRLDVKSIALGTADFGEPPIVGGDSAASPLVEYVTSADGLRMPPDGEGEPLNPEQVAKLRRWIDEGALWPEELANEGAVVLSTEHWSFQPLRNPDPPGFSAQTPHHFRSGNPIDAYVARQLEKRGLASSPQASRRTRIRRLYLDMLGLLPTPAQVETFVDDPSPNAWSKLIEDVLASPHYGERWARHWLDVVRFGESTGYEVNRDRTNAWYYRDYVIKALNDDKSYQDFVREQLAGDTLGVDEATGFLVGGPHDIVKSPDINLTLMQRQDELADYVNTTSTAFLGLTVGCARCHNHKFDPILQRDYYALQAVFAGVQHGERKLRSQAKPDILESIAQARKELDNINRQLAKLRSQAVNRVAVEAELPMVNAKKNEDSFPSTPARFLKFIIRKTNSAEPCLDELEVISVEGENVALSQSGAVATSSGNFLNNPKHQLKHINDGRVGNDHSWISDSVGAGWVQVEFARLANIERVVWGRDREGKYSDRLPIQYAILVSPNGKDWQEVSNSSRRKPFLVNGKEPDDAFVSRLAGEDQQRLARQLLMDRDNWQQKWNQWESSIPTGYVGKFTTPAKIHRLYRGDPLSPREQVAPDTLQVLGTLGLDSSANDSTRRRKLADWIVSEENPLTARVIVNRVWQYHFGRGLVATPSDFGKAGTSPSHPELLDWLALHFMKNGWSLKWLHRQILTSATYQQSSQPRAEPMKQDAGAVYLWRFPPRRLEAEVIRDCVLQVSGKLNWDAGGPGFLLFRVDHENVHHYFPLEKFEDQHFRRMIYMTKIRQEQDDVFGTFDCPDGGQTIPTRTRSTTALQALNLMNSPFMLGQAQFLAERLEAARADAAEQIVLAFRWVYGREPTVEEFQDVEEFVGREGLASFCRVLFNTNEFLFLN